MHLNPVLENLVILVLTAMASFKPSTTMDIYGPLINERQEEAARIMDEW
jgi:hypothetical protein